MLFFLDNLLIPQESVSLQCVFHSIRFKVNKGWSTAVLLFFALYFPYAVPEKTGQRNNLRDFIFKHII